MSKKLEIDEYELRNVLYKIYEDGFYGSLDIKEEVVEGILEDIKEKGKLNLKPILLDPIITTWASNY